MESYIITFVLGFLIDKISLFPFVVGVGVGALINNNNYHKYYYVSKEYFNLCQKKMKHLKENIENVKIQEINEVYKNNEINENNQNNQNNETEIK